jgi:outer membrane immunogenic protein
MNSQHRDMHMRKLLLTTAALVALTAGEGFGADISRPVMKAPIGMAPSWAGFYIGGQVGGASVSTSFKDFDDFFDNQGLNGDRKLTWTAGVYGGINFQHDSFVYGIEAAWSWLDGTVTSFPDADEDFLRSKLRDYGSVKARAGLAFGSSLVYVAAGPAWGGSHFSMQSGSEVASGNSHRLGLAAATGVEHMFSPNWILRGQVEYAQFQTQRITSNYDDRFGQESSVLTGTLGLSYKFGGQ